MHFGKVFWNRLLYAFILLIVLGIIIAGIIVYTCYPAWTEKLIRFK